MDEKTERLRDLFVETTGEETVTESQAVERGSLLDAGGDDVCAVVEAMRDQFAFDTDLSDDALCSVVRAFYAGADDDEIAERMGVSPDAVFEARMDLLLVRPDDGDVDSAALREFLDGGMSVAAAASELGVDVTAARRALRAREARERARATSYRYQSAFEERLTDLALSVRLTDSAREDGLAEAAEDAETNVEF